MRLLDVAKMMEDSLRQNSSSDGIYFDNSKGTKWLNGVFQRHIINLKSDLVENGQFTFGPTPRPFIFTVRLVADRLEWRIDSSGSSRSSRGRQLGSTPMERD